MAKSTDKKRLQDKLRKASDMAKLVKMWEQRGFSKQEIVKLIHKFI